MMLRFILCLGICVSILSCSDSDQGVCPQPSSEYLLDFSTDDVMIDNINEVRDGMLVPLSVDLDSLNAIALDEGDIEDIRDAFFVTLRIVDESTIEFFRPSSNGLESVSLTYSFSTDQLIDVFLENGDIVVFEISEDCSYIEYCLIQEVLSPTGDFSNPSIFRNSQFCGGRPSIEFLPEDLPPSTNGFTVGVLSVRFIFNLQE